MLQLELEPLELELATGREEKEVWVPQQPDVLTYYLL